MKVFIRSLFVLGMTVCGLPVFAVAVGESAPCIELDQYGSSGAIGKGSTCRADKSDKKLVLDFFATWCGYCQRNLPTFEALAAENSEKAEFRIVGLDDNPEDLKNYFKDRDLTNYNISIDAENASVAPFGLQGIPTTVVIDSDGTILLVHVGTIDTAEERQAVVDALNR